MIAVSIIVPVYNAKDYLDKCVQSLLKQTLQNIEIILVNDGSTDDSGKICNEYSERDGRIRVMHQRNQGASAARNTGIKNARGKYIGFVDSDDFVEDNMYEIMYEQAESAEADIVFCNLYTNEKKMQPYLPDGIYEGIDLMEQVYPRLISVINEKQYGKTLRGAVWCKIFRTKMLLENNIFFNEKLVYNEDGLFCIESTLKCQKYLYLGQDYLYHHILVEGSITKRYIENLWIRQKELALILKKCTSDVSYDFTRQIAKKLFEVAVYSIENEVKKSNRKSFREKLRGIKDITSDGMLKNAFQNMDFRGLNKINRFYYVFMKAKAPLILLAGAKYRYRKNELF